MHVDLRLNGALLLGELVELLADVVDGLGLERGAFFAGLGGAGELGAGGR